MPQVTNPSTAPGQKFTFDSFLLRGRHEREYHGTFSYVVESGKARVTGWRCDVTPTPDELIQLDEDAQDDCAEWIADMAEEIA